MLNLPIIQILEGNYGITLRCNKLFQKKIEIFFFFEIYFNFFLIYWFSIFIKFVTEIGIVFSSLLVKMLEGID